MRTLRASRKGAYFFLIDVFLGIFIFLISIAVIMSFNIFKPSSTDILQRMDMLSEDIFNTEMRDADVTNNLINDLKGNNEFYNPLFAVDQYVLVLVNNSDFENATQLIGNMTEWLPITLGFNYTITYYGTTYNIYSREAQTTTKDLSVSRFKKEKITMVQSNITTTYPIAVTGLELWQ